MLRVSFVLAWIAITNSGAVASAQTSDDDRARAAEAYDRGARAFREREFAESAGWFERANQLAPSPIATVQAIRAHLRVGNHLRAGTLALSLEGDAGLSPRVEETVREAIDAASSRYARVQISCTATCTLSVDGESTRATRFFLEPDRQVVIVATFATGTRTETVVGPAGSRRDVAFEAPPGSIPADGVAEAELEDELTFDDDNPYRISRSAFLSRPRAVFFLALGASAAVGAITTWSYIDTRDSKSDLRRAIADGADDQTLALIRARRDRDIHRTRGYIGFTSVVVLATGVCAIFTDWSPERDSSPEDEPGTTTSVDASPTGASITVLHRF